MSQLCSYCMKPVPEKHFRLWGPGDEAKDRPMLFCMFRCLGLYAITKGWPGWTK